MSKSAAAFGVYDTSTRRFYHGTKAELKPGDLLQPGYSSNYTERRSPWIYFSETLHVVTWERSWQRAKVRAESIRQDRPGRLWMTPM